MASVALVVSEGVALVDPKGPRTKPRNTEQA